MALSSRDVLLPQRERNASVSRVLARIAINVFEVLRYGSANCRLVTGVPHFISFFSLITTVSVFSFEVLYFLYQYLGES